MNIAFSWQQVLDALVPFALGAYTIGSIIYFLLQLGPFKGIKELFQGKFEHRYMQMRIDNGVQTHELEYTFRGARLLGLHKFFHATPFVCDRRYYDISAVLNSDGPDFKEMKDEKFEGWELRNNLYSQLLVQKIEVKPESKYKVVFSKHVSNTEEYYKFDSPPKIEYEKSDGSIFAETHNVRVTSPFDKAAKIRADLLLPWDGTSEDILDINVYRNGQELPPHTCRLSLLKDISVTGKKINENGLQVSVLAKARNQYQLFVQSVEITPGDDFKVVVRKQKVRLKK